MGDTYNILKKYAYLNYVDDPYYGKRPEWDDQAPKVNPIRTRSKKNFLTTETRYYDPSGLYTTLDPAGVAKKYGEGWSHGDAILMQNILWGDEEQRKLALGIYSRIARGIVFGKSDPLTQEFRTLYPYLYSSIEESINNTSKDPKKRQALRFVQSLGGFGENLLGSEVDYLAQSGLYDNVATKLGLEPEDFNKLKEESRKLTNGYSFANYVPGMVAAGLIPTAIGSLMGRPFLGMLIGALLSGGVGYYGYNRLNNPNYQGYEWLDKKLGYTPAARTTNQPQTNVQPTPAGPTNTDMPASQPPKPSSVASNGINTPKTEQATQPGGPTGSPTGGDNTDPVSDEDPDTSILDLY